MKRLLVHVEGSSEETFIKELVAPYLYLHGYSSVSPRLLGNSRQRTKRGGARSWQGVKKEIIRHMMEDKGCYSTTMVDFYGLPAQGEGAWPGRAAADQALPHTKASMVEQAIAMDICEFLAVEPDVCRFIPFLVMHEFEGLLFSDCHKLAICIGRRDIETQLQAVRDSFGSPEEINDSPNTAPSKRVLSLFPGYQKVIMGNIAAIEIGLDTIRAQCPHFSDWISKLESLT